MLGRWERTEPEPIETRPGEEVPFAAAGEEASVWEVSEEESPEDTEEAASHDQEETARAGEPEGFDIAF